MKYYTKIAFIILIFITYNIFMQHIFPQSVKMQNKTASYADDSEIDNNNVLGFGILNRLPGLWNGAMSDWNTIFIEVPLSTFNPVKTVNDLLRSEHQ